MGEIKDFTGIQSVYENPEQAFLEIFTDDYSIDESLEIIVEKIILLLQ